MMWSCSDCFIIDQQGWQTLRINPKVPLVVVALSGQLGFDSSAVVVADDAAEYARMLNTQSPWASGRGEH